MPDSSSSNEAPGFLGRRPWLWVIFAFTMLIGAWTTLFWIAFHNQPEVVPLKTLVP